MTYEEAAKFLKNAIAHPQKPDGESKYPNYWRAKFNEVLHLLDEQAEILRIFKWLFSEESLEYEDCPFGVEVDGVTLHFKTKDDYKTIMEWLEEDQ